MAPLDFNLLYIKSQFTGKMRALIPAATHFQFKDKSREHAKLCAYTEVYVQARLLSYDSCTAAVSPVKILQHNDSILANGAESGK